MEREKKTVSKLSSPFSLSLPLSFHYLFAKGCFSFLHSLLAMTVEPLHFCNVLFCREKKYFCCFFFCVKLNPLYRTRSKENRTYKIIEWYILNMFNAAMQTQNRRSARYSLWNRLGRTHNAYGTERQRFSRKSVVVECSDVKIEQLFNYAIGVS